MSRLTLTTDPVKLGYLAGLIDGEGCITRGNGSYRFQIEMSDRPCIEAFCEATGIGGVFESTTRRGLPMFKWYLSRQLEVQEFLTALLPYLRGVKREKALLALDNIAGRIVA